MEPKKMLLPTMGTSIGNGVFRYCVAIVAVVSAVGLRLLLDSVLNERLPLITLFAAVAIVASYCGRGPATFALVLGLAAITFFIIEPRFSLGVERHEDLVGLLFYAIIGAGCIALIEQLRTARRFAEEKSAETLLQYEQVQRESQLRRAAEAAINEERERLRVTLASIGDGVITTDAEGRVVFLNEVAQHLTGWTQQAAQGCPMSDIFCIVNETTRQSVENPALRSLREGKIVGLANHTLLISRNGEETPIDDSAAPILDHAKNTIGSVLVFRDVTEQRRAEQEVIVSEARKSAILETALDCIVTIDHHGLVVEFNPAAERTFGYSRAHVIGRELADLIIPPAFREQHRRGMTHYLATGEGPVLGKRLELSAMRADGSEFPVELAITRISTVGSPLFTAYLRDISQRTRAEQHRSARLAVTHALNQAQDLKSGAEGILHAVCESLGWDIGLFWMVNKNSDCLICLQCSHSPKVMASHFELASYNRTFAEGEGLPGRVWVTGKPAWILEISQEQNFPRRDSALSCSLRSAFACPIVIRNQTLGVIEFFSSRIREPDADLLEMMDTVTGNVGQFIERRTAEEELRQSEAELADFFDNATVGLHWVGPSGIILRVNRAELEMLGYQREEFVGHSIVDFHADENVIHEVLRRLQSGEQLHEYPARMRCKDGSIKEVLIDSSAMFRDGGFVHSRCFIRDITERKRAEQELRQAQRQLQAVFNQQFQFMSILSSDGTVLEANETCFRVTGFGREQVIGKRLWDTPWWDSLPYMQDQWQRHMAEVALSGGPVISPMEYSMADGTIRHATAVVTGLKDESGLVTNIVVEGHDDTERRQQETALRESETKLRLMADSIPQLAWMARPDGYIFWYNRRWYQYTGTTTEQMEGWGWQMVHDPKELPTVLARWRASIDTGEPFDMVFPLKGADQKFRPFLTRINPWKDADGRIVYWFGTNTDISELKEAREALATNEERLRLALDAGRMGVWDWNIRTGDLKWSDSLEPLHGLAPGTFGGTFEHFQALIHPDDRQNVNAAIGRALEEGGEFYVEFRNLWSNGGIHWIAGSGKVFPGDDGLPGRMIGIGMDVTQRKRVEQTARFLADASAALAVLVDFDSTIQKVASLAVPYFADWATVDVLEQDGTLRRVVVAHINPAKVQLAHELHRRFPPDPNAPQGVWTILRTGQAEIVSQISDELLVQSIQDEEQLRLVRELGLKSYIGVPLRVRGKTLGVFTFIAAESGQLYDETDFAVAQDLADRAAIAIENSQLYRELRDADRRKDEFLATLAHELRNPLAPIRNGLQVLRLSNMDAGHAVEVRSMMERQLNQMVRLVDDLLDVSRITRNKLELRMQKIELAQVIHSAIETSRPLIEESGHQFSLSLPPTPIHIEADLTRLSQVFSNLLNNSAKYTRSGGHISLTVEGYTDEVAVKIQDNGMGIPAESLPRIFELFSQVDLNMENAQGGLGIGLSLVRRLVEMHGGKVDARSDGPGRGSEFTVRLPILTGKEQKQPEKPVYSGERTESSKRRILIVDDNQDAALSLGLMLKLLGNETQTAHDGLAALSAAEQFRPKIILLDIGLPKMNGYEACRHIRQQPWSTGMVIIAVTGWGQEDDRRRSAEAGFDHHLVKPVELAALEELLASSDTPLPP